MRIGGCFLLLSFFRINISWRHTTYQYPDFTESAPKMSPHWTCILVSTDEQKEMQKAHQQYGDHGVSGKKKPCMCTISLSVFNKGKLEAWWWWTRISVHRMTLAGERRAEWRWARGERRCPHPRPGQGNEFARCARPNATSTATSATVGLPANGIGSVCEPTNSWPNSTFNFSRICVASTWSTCRSKI